MKPTTVQDVSRHHVMRMFRMSASTLLIEVYAIYEGEQVDRYCIPSHSIDYFHEKMVKNQSRTEIILKSGQKVTCTTPYASFLEQIIEADDAS